MNDASAIALSAQLAVLHQTDVIANNLANLSTTGFKGEHVLFSQFLTQTSDGTPVSYVEEQGTARDPSQGYAVLSDSGSPLVIPEGSGEITIGADGSISTGRQGTVGKLGLVTFVDQQAMTPTAGGVYTTIQQPQPSSDAKLMQGSLESSNVEPIIEITRLINSQHNVEYAKTFVDALATQISNAIDHLGKTP